ncbi:MAG: zinc ABC transporter substrate-binding protein [Phycisphaeraceae bacterium]|nr:zinc ABC transporter substrate-binding protein [Phycisphaeraceae bacterium]MCW5755294.1 zinc ABC transporter substrate-binding protein [Phycisphaeraceae bacterium]
MLQFAPRSARACAKFSSQILGAFFITILTGLGGCAKSAETENRSPDRIKITCTVGMVAEVVRHVAGETAEVTSLMGEGVDPHLYKPTRSDISRLLNADVVFYNGLLLEGKLTDVLAKAAASGKHVFPIAEFLPRDRLLTPGDFEGHEDPHVWMDPTLWSLVADIVRDRLSELRPEHAATFAANAAAYRSKLAELDAYALAVLTTIPEAQRVLVTAHDAFGYFGRRYGFEVVGIQGISTESEAGVRDIERLVELIVSRKIAAVFVESTVSDRNTQALVVGAARRGWSVRIGGSLFADAMGAAGSYEGTYIGMIDHNVTHIARALRGEAPERGMTGQLSEPVP